MAMAIGLLHAVSAGPSKQPPTSPIQYPTCDLGLLVFKHTIANCAQTPPSAGLVLYKPKIGQCITAAQGSAVSFYSAAVGSDGDNYDCQLYGWNAAACTSKTSTANDNGAELVSVEFNAADNDFGICTSLKNTQRKTVQSFKVCCAPKGQHIVCPAGN